MTVRVLTGINTTGTLHLGNYCGAIRPCVRASRLPDTDSFFFMADLHALIKCQDPARVDLSRLQIAASWLAAGLDPEHVTLYRQSDIPEIPQLNWLLNCVCSKGLMNRAHAYKAFVEANAAQSEDVDAGVSMGLYCYPILMAADILLYQSDLVPIGADQKQHLELARNLAERFNSVYGETFVVPDGYFPKVGARIMSLQDPTAKMSKSDTNENAKIMMTDEPDAIIRKFRRAVTDSDSVVRASDDKPGVTNLMSIYGALTGRSMEEIEREFDGRGYGDFKLAVGETVADALRPIQSEYKRILSEKDYLMSVLADSAEKARRIAGRKLAKVARKIGFVDCKY